MLGEERNLLEGRGFDDLLKALALSGFDFFLETTSLGLRKAIILASKGKDNPVRLVAEEYYAVRGFGDGPNVIFFEIYEEGKRPDLESLMMAIF